MSTSNSGGADERAGYHHGNLRESLLDQGLRLLEESGEQGFSLRELARRVGVTANAAYRHFANKNDLMMALAAAGLDRFAASQAAAWQAADGDARERFLAIGCDYVRFARDHPALFRLMFGRFVAEHRNAELERASEAAFAGLCQGVGAALELASDAEETRLAAYNAWALVHGFSHLILDGQLDDAGQPPERVVESALRQWLHSRADRAGRAG